MFQKRTHGNSDYTDGPTALFRMLPLPATSGLINTEGYTGSGGRNRKSRKNTLPTMHAEWIGPCEDASKLASEAQCRHACRMLHAT